MNDRLAAGVEWLRGQGLNLFAVLDTARILDALPGHPADGFAGFRDVLADYQRLILIGNGGGKLWRAMDHDEDRANPVDRFSLTQTRYFARRFLDNPPSRYLYPGDMHLPLQQIGRLAGWHHPSPLGLGINPTYGLWFSYRVAFVVDAALPVTARKSSRAPCDDCLEKPCIQACPVAALAADRSPDLNLCLSQRLADNSICALKCDARLACPVGAEYRYTREQLNYHYRRSLESLQRYAEKAKP